MIRLPAIAVAALVLAPLATAHPTPPWPPSIETHRATSLIFRGTVFTVHHDELTLLMRDGAKKFVVGANTLVLVNGNGSMLNDVRPGYVAEITAVLQGDKPKARFIDAFIPR